MNFIYNLFNIIFEQIIKCFKNTKKKEKCEEVVEKEPLKKNEDYIIVDIHNDEKDYLIERN